MKAAVVLEQSRPFLIEEVKFDAPIKCHWTGEIVDDASNRKTL